MYIRSALNILKSAITTNSRVLAQKSLAQNQICNDLKPLYNYVSCAGYRQRVFIKKDNWVRKRGGGWDENLTKENQEYLEQTVIDSYRDALSPLKEAPWKKGEWSTTEKNKRLGVIAVKLGSIPQWTVNGKKFHVTLLQVLDNHVVDYIPGEIFANKSDQLREQTKDGKYAVMVVGALSSDPRLYSPQYLELFKNSGLPPKRKLTKFIVSPNAVVQPGTPLYASHFRIGDYVDVGAHTIGFGFQGVMKRWGFKGGPRSHGATKFHRKRGTVGSGRKRRKLIKGTKMAGVTGGMYRTRLGLKVWRINTKYNILFIHGPMIPGPTHCYVRVSDSHLKKNTSRWTPESHPPFPTCYMEDLKEPLKDEYFDDEVHQFASPTITFEGFQVKKQKKREGAKLAKIK